MVQPDNVKSKLYKIPHKAFQKSSLQPTPSYHNFADYPIMSGKYTLPDDLPKPDLLQRIFHLPLTHFSYKRGDSLHVIQHKGVEYIRLNGHYCFSDYSHRDYFSHTFPFYVFVADDHYRLASLYSHADIKIRDKVIKAKHKVYEAMFHSLCDLFNKEFMIQKRPSTKSLCKEVFSPVYRKLTKAEIKKHNDTLALMDVLPAAAQERGGRYVDHAKEDEDEEEETPTILLEYDDNDNDNDNDKNC